METITRLALDAARRVRLIETRLAEEKAALEALTAAVPESDRAEYESEIGEMDRE